MKDIEPRFYDWILGAAQESFTTKVAELELELARHRHLPHDDSVYNTHMTRPRSRHECIASAKSQIGEYQVILQWLCDQRMAFQEQLAKGLPVTIPTVHKHEKPTTSARRRNAV